MHGNVFRRHYVYLYESSLFTRSPLLKRIYCESHRFEPWAVHGSACQYGTYRYRNVLYIEQDERDRLLADIPDRLQQDPGWLQDVRERYQACLRQVARGWRRPDPLRLAMDTARYLSVGVFKEAFEPSQAQAFLSQFMPMSAQADTVLALYQPRAQPHFLKYELRRHWYAARRDVPGFVRRAAHHSRFLLEPGPLEAPQAAEAELQQLWNEYGRAADISAHRRALLLRHREAVEAAQSAEHRLLQAMHEHARYSLRSYRTVHQALEFIEFISTTEELKHILTVETARVLRRHLEASGHRVEETDLEDLG